MIGKRLVRTIRGVFGGSLGEAIEYVWSRLTCIEKIVTALPGAGIPTSVCNKPPTENYASKFRTIVTFNAQLTTSVEKRISYAPKAGVDNRSTSLRELTPCNGSGLYSIIIVRFVSKVPRSHSSSASKSLGDSS